MPRITSRPSAHRRPAQFAGLLAAALSIVPIAGAAAVGAGTDIPVDAHGNLLGATALSADDAWAVGTLPGHPWHVISKHWDGSEWTPVKIPALHSGGAEALYGVDGTAADDVWAVGRGFLPDEEAARSIIEHWNGSRWSLVTAPKRTVDNQLTAVVALSRRDVWAVGKQVAGFVQPLVDHWNGRSWSAVATPSMPGYVFEAVSASGPDDVWAVGEDKAYEHVLVEHWDGSSWTVSTNSFVTHEDVYLPAVVALAPDDVHAIGNTGNGVQGGPFDDAWDGSRWTLTQTGLPWSDALYAASGTSSDDIWATGSSGDDTFAAHWNGSTWTAVNTPTPRSKYAYFNSVSMASSTDGWAVGIYRVMTRRYCLIEHWDGSRWEQVTS